MPYSSESQTVVSSLVGGLVKFYRRHRPPKEYKRPGLALARALALPARLAGLPVLLPGKLAMERPDRNTLGIYENGHLDLNWEKLRNDRIKFLATTAHEFRHHEQFQLMATYDPAWVKKEVRACMLARFLSSPKTYTGALAG